MVDSNLVVAAGSIVAVAVAAAIAAVVAVVAVAVAIVAVAVAAVVAVGSILVAAVVAVVAAVGSIVAAAVADWIESVVVAGWVLFLVPPLVVHYRSKACVPGLLALVMKRLFHQLQRT